MKRSARLGLLGLFVALAAAFGVTQLGGVAHAQIPGVTKTCVLTTGGGAVPSPATIGTSVTCTITVTAATTPSPIVINVTNATITSGSAVQATSDIATVAFTPSSVTVTCIGAAPITCDATAANPIVITEVLTLTGGTVTELFNGITLTSPVITAVSAGTFTSVLVTCAPVIGAPAFPAGIPGPIGGTNIVGIGVLPSPVQCTVQPLGAVGTTPIVGAPGTFEISSLQGALLDASGNLHTNLRIGCGDRSQALTPTCQGVTFAVLGFGVGVVEVRIRFEPAAIVIGQPAVEFVVGVGFVAPTVIPSLTLSVNPVTVGQTGQALVRFNRTFNCAVAFGVASVAGGTACVDPTTGTPIIFNLGSALNGNVVLNIGDSLVASWVGAQPTATAGVPSSTAGFTTTANQTIVRCGFFPTAGVPFNPTAAAGGFVPGFGGAPALAAFFGGCEAVSATYRGNNPGATNVAATFVPDLPGAFGNTFGNLLPANTAGLLGLFGNTLNPTSVRTLEVTGAAPVGDVALSRGCNNVSPTVTEAAAAYAARVSPSGALVAIWEHQAATNTFRGFSPQAGAPNDLAGVTRLRPVFVCVSAAAILSQPPA